MWKTIFIPVRGRLARTLCHLNHSFTCSAYVFYRRSPIVAGAIDISVVILSGFVENDEQEGNINQLKNHLEAGYVLGEKGIFKRLHTDRVFEMSLHFPGVENTPFRFRVDQSQLDSVGFVIDHFKTIAVNSPANGEVKISEVERSIADEPLWNLTICDIQEKMEIEVAEDDEDDEELMNSSEVEEEKEYRRAYSEALEEGKAKDNRIPIMLIGQDRAGKTSLMTHLLGLPFNKDQLSTIGIEVNIIELTEQNAKEPWISEEKKKFMTNEVEANSAIYKKAAECVVPKKLVGDAPEPLKPVKPLTPVTPVRPLPIKPLSTQVISEIKLQRSTEGDQREVIRVFLTDFAGQKIYYDTHGCFVKPHSPYVLVYDLSMEFDDPAVPRFKASKQEKEEKMNNPFCTTNSDKLKSWLKFLQGLGKFQDEDFIDKSSPCITAKGEEFELPPVLIALTHCDKVERSKIEDVEIRIKKVLKAGTYKNVFSSKFFRINNTLEDDKGDHVRELREKLFDLSNAVLKKENLMPLKWLHFEVALSKLSSNSKYIPVDEAKKVAKECGIQDFFDQAIKFLHRLGAVVYYSGSSKVVLDPPWLMNLFTEVISIPTEVDPKYRYDNQVLMKKGILFQEYLKKKAPPKDAELIEELMKKFCLISPCQHEGKPAFYVPSLAPLMMLGKELEESTIPSLFVTFPYQFVPMGLFTKLQVKLISKYKKNLPKQEDPSFYCNYSLLPLIIDGNVYDVRLIDLEEFIMVTVFPLENGNHSTFASNFLAILKKCLDDLKLPDQLLFSMTSYDLEVKCTCCFGKEETKCSRHNRIQCDSDRCGHRHFWKLSELQRLYDDGSPAVCQSNKRSSKLFDIKSVTIWLNNERDAAREDSSNCGFSDENPGGTSSSVSDAPTVVESSSKCGVSEESLSETSSSGPNSFKRKRSTSDTTASQERKRKRKKPSSPAKMCKTCTSNDETPLPRHRDKWPILKIEYGCFEKICKLLDLSDRSKVSLTSALGCFDQDTADHIEKKYEGTGGVGIAKEVLGLWGSSNEKSNVGALRKILKNIMRRRDVVKKIKKWKKMSVCYGCGIKWNSVSDAPMVEGSSRLGASSLVEARSPELILEQRFETQAMVEDSSQCGSSSENSGGASCLGAQTTDDFQRRPMRDNVRAPPELNWRLPPLKDIGSQRYQWSSKEIQSQLPTDILLVTTTDHEFKSCYSYMKQVRRSCCPNGVMVDFGEFGDQHVKVALIRFQTGPIPALIFVYNATEYLKPKVVLCVGICATMNRKKAKLGDVIISAKLATYASKKVTSDGTTEHHGIKANVSRNVARLILSAADGWQPPLKEPSSLDVTIHRQALMLSGPELVDNDERRQKLLDDFPDAIGLEMEGEGLYSAAYDLGIEWAVIKGVSDYADGSKKTTEDWQSFASTMAASVVHNMFQYADVLKQWPHYKKPGDT